MQSPVVLKVFFFTMCYHEINDNDRATVTLPTLREYSLPKDPHIYLSIIIRNGNVFLDNIIETVEVEIDGNRGETGGYPPLGYRLWAEVNKETEGKKRLFLCTVSVVYAVSTSKTYSLWHNVWRET